MKRWIGWAAALACAVVFLNADRVDVSQLRPVELIYIYKENDTVWLETDTGDTGCGRNLNQALLNLKKTTPAKMFLDTADYLLVTDQTVGFVPECLDFLRPSAEVCILREKADLQAAAQYLSAHSPGVTLQQLRSKRITLPVLEEEEERFRLA